MPAVHGDAEEKEWDGEEPATKEGEMEGENAAAVASSSSSKGAKGKGITSFFGKKAGAAVEEAAEGGRQVGKNKRPRPGSINSFFGGSKGEAEDGAVTADNDGEDVAEDGEGEGEGEEEAGDLGDAEENEEEDEEEEEAPRREPKDPNRDRASAYREMLIADAKRSMKRKKRAGMIDQEASEEELDDGAGRYGLDDAPALDRDEVDDAQARNERLLAKRGAELAEELDLEGIVDDISDDEGDANVDMEQHLLDKDRAKDDAALERLMSDMKDGFQKQRQGRSRGGRNAHLLGEDAAEGNLRQKARLGLGNSDSEGGAGDGEEEDEEQAMLKKLERERIKGMDALGGGGGGYSDDEDNSEGEGADGEKRKRRENGEGGGSSDDDDDSWAQRQAFKRARHLSELENMRPQIRPISLDDNESQSIMAMTRRTNTVSVRASSMAAKAKAMTSRGAARRMTRKDEVDDVEDSQLFGMTLTGAGAAGATAKMDRAMGGSGGGSGFGGGLPVSRSGSGSGSRSPTAGSGMDLRVASGGKAVSDNGGGAAGGAGKGAFAGMSMQRKNIGMFRRRSFLSEGAGGEGGGRWRRGRPQGRA
jgi:hypothetical protein